MDSPEERLLDAVRTKDYTTVELLIEEGVDVNCVDGGGWTALHWASNYGYLNIASLLLLNNADVNSKIKYGRTPLHWACGAGRLDVAELLLLANNANINAIDGRGNTPLHDASAHGRFDVVKLLVEKGADIGIKGVQSETAEDLARRWGRTTIANFCFNLMFGFGTRGDSETQSKLTHKNSV